MLWWWFHKLLDEVIVIGKTEFRILYELFSSEKILKFVPNDNEIIKNSVNPSPEQLETNVISSHEWKLKMSTRVSETCSNK